MSDRDVLKLMEQANAAIIAEDIYTLMDVYADDAVLVVEPGRIAKGRPRIR